MRTAMIAMTTSNSIRVKPRVLAWRTVELLVRKVGWEGPIAVRATIRRGGVTGGGPGMSPGRRGRGERHPEGQGVDLAGVFPLAAGVVGGAPGPTFGSNEGFVAVWSPQPRGERRPNSKMPRVARIRSCFRPMIPPTQGGSRDHPDEGLASASPCLQCRMTGGCRLN